MNARPTGPDLAQDTEICTDTITDCAALIEAMGTFNGQRDGDTGYWWEFIGPVIGYSPEWGNIRPVLAAGVRGEFGILIWAQEADPDAHEIPVATSPTNPLQTWYSRVPDELSDERLPVPEGREIPLADVLSAVAHFCETGTRPDRLQWRAVDFDTAYGQDRATGGGA